MGLLDLIPYLAKLLDKLIPDRDAAEKAKNELDRLAQTTELDLLIKQVDANKTEAKNPNLFVSGWRPMMGWICVFGVGWNMVAIPVLLFLAASMGHPFEPPILDNQMLYDITFGLLGLGLGSLRSYEKLKGVAK